jgi:hypothetical protein
MMLKLPWYVKARNPRRVVTPLGAFTAPTSVDADIIVKRVNAYDGLVRELRTLVERCDTGDFSDGSNPCTLGASELLRELGVPGYEAQDA